MMRCEMRGRFVARHERICQEAAYGRPATRAWPQIQPLRLNQVKIATEISTIDTMDAG